jgi:hypothetical protein
LIDAQTKLKAIQRELSFRKNLYPKWVAAGRISQEKADREIEIMDAIAKDYQDYIDAHAEQRTLL